MGEKNRSSKPDSFSYGCLSDTDRKSKKGESAERGFINFEEDNGTDKGYYERSNDIVSKILDVENTEDLLNMIKDDLSVLVPYEFGSLKYSLPEDPGDELDLELDEGFSDEIDFISSHYALSGAKEFSIEENVECDPKDPWEGGMIGTCRARTKNGDPVIIRLRSALVIPLYNKNMHVGIISLFSSKEKAFNGFTDQPPINTIWRSIGNALGSLLELESIKGERDRARNLLDSSEDLLVLWRRKGSIWEVDCNRKADIFINRPDLLPEMMEGPFFAPPGKEWERGMFAWSKAFEFGQSFQVDLELMDADGNRKPHLCKFSPYFEKGGITGVKMTGIEIACINDAMEHLEDLNNSYRLMVSIISHDLKNPISAIMGYNELLRFSSEEKRGIYIDKINGLSNRMTETIQMVSVLSKIKEGKMKKEFKLMDISQMVQNSLEYLFPKTDAYDIIIDFKGDDFKITGHEMLQQVVLNLLDNAMKYSPEGSSITVALNADITGVTLSISDQGEGIPDKFKQSIFQRFERAERVDGIAGTGLGLAISKGIVDMHDGRIWVQDNEKGGSVFKVHIPWSQD